MNLMLICFLTSAWCSLEFYGCYIISLLRKKTSEGHCKKFGKERKCCCSLIHPLRGREYRGKENEH